MTSNDPDIPKDYVCSYVIVKVSNNLKKFNVKAANVSNKTFSVNLFWFSAYGSIETFNPDIHELVDDNLVLNYPMIKDDSAREGVV